VLLDRRMDDLRHPGERRHHAASDQAPAAVEMLAVDVLAFDPDRSAT